MPQLYRLASIVHGAAATEVSVERLFSGVHFIYSALRTRLKSSILNDIMIIRTNKNFELANEKMGIKKFSGGSKRTRADQDNDHNSTPTKISRTASINSNNSESGIQHDADLIIITENEV